MARLEYLDFDLQIERDGDTYRAEVLRSPTGGAYGTFVLPFAGTDLELLIMKMGASGGRRRGGSMQELETARQLGGALFQALFTDDVGACLKSSIRLARAEPGRGLRVRLRLQDVGELANLPWEYLYDASVNEFLAQSDFTPVVRYIDVPVIVSPLAVAPPLRILVMASSPEESDEPVLDIQAERARLEAALAPLIQSGTVSLDWMDRATLSNLQEVLNGDKQYHVMHFIGHGSFDQSMEQGVLQLVSQRGRPEPTPEHRIGPLLHDHPSLRLVVLNSCEGARHSRDDPFSSVAASLIRRGIPAVVAMQFEISDRSAVSFAGGFYDALAQGFPVDAAVGEGRKAILVQPNDVEWGTPVLFMRSPDGVLFELAPGVAPPVAHGDMTVPAGTPAAATPNAVSRAAVLEAPALSAAPPVDSTRGRPSRLRLPLVGALQVGAWTKLLGVLAVFIFIAAAAAFAMNPPNPDKAGPGGGGGPGATPAPASQLANGPNIFPTMAPRLIQPVDSDPLPTGGLLVFQEGIHIWTAGPQGRDKRPLTVEGENQHPTWSPDGSMIAFSSKRNGGRWQIYVMFADGHDQRAITADGPNSPGGDGNRDPAWSADGKYIAYTAGRVDNQTLSIFYVDSNGYEQPRQIVTGGANFSPAWAPDGKSIAYVANNPCYTSIWVINIDGSNKRNLFCGGASPTWSKDGKRIAFVNNRNSTMIKNSSGLFHGDISLMSSEGTNLVQVTLKSPVGAGKYTCPRWTPDDKHLTHGVPWGFAPGQDVVMVNADGSGTKQLFTGEVLCPEWRPTP